MENLQENINLQQRIIQIRERIEKAALSSGRRAEDIRLIAVTKTFPPEIIQQAVNYGLTDLGENRVQELVDKTDKVRGDVNWHLIGHLQRNKVKYIIDKVAMIQSLDSEELAEEIQKRANKIGRKIPVLVEVNVGGEESKFGIRPDETQSFMEYLKDLPNIQVKGLMTVAPACENPEMVRDVFRELRQIFIDIKRKNIDNIDMEFLSMGMTNDFEVAISEGSNMVRIGTGIFGKR